MVKENYMPESYPSHSQRCLNPTNPQLASPADDGLSPSKRLPQKLLAMHLCILNMQMRSAARADRVQRTKELQVTFPLIADSVDSHC
ncbi:jg7685 [Pararge aegeria aegeria]|uniref:Jg7685 protein n=1 Tax=Pararge aegeria aegeria TaxID=348720 RepID=A0A8S4RYY0_9NEOP|nr:jg7685 [Pararge aegeria aegeria]